MFYTKSHLAPAVNAWCSNGERSDFLAVRSSFADILPDLKHARSLDLNLALDIQLGGSRWRHFVQVIHGNSFWSEHN